MGSSANEAPSMRNLTPRIAVENQIDPMSGFGTNAHHTKVLHGLPTGTLGEYVL
jgi:hypothetical protein